MNISQGKMALNHSIFGGMTLKALLENPDLHHAPAALSGAPVNKAKKTGDNGSADVDITSAFLGPQLWNKNYNSGDLNMEYMDLDEFLGENMTDIPVVDSMVLNNLITPSSPSSPSAHSRSLLARGGSPLGSPHSSSLGSPHSSPLGCPHSSPLGSPHSSPLGSPHSSPLGSPHSSPPRLVTPPLIRPRGSPLHMMGSPRGISIGSPHNVGQPIGIDPSPGPSPKLVAPATVMGRSSHLLAMSKAESTEEPTVQKPVSGEAGAGMPGRLSPGFTPPVSPLPLKVDFSLTDQDLALSSVPGQSIFDPTCHTFTEDELKPQPMIKKSRKVFVPDEHKDEKYWARRKKNNFAAKRSRDARRVKENQIAMRAAYLEKENDSLRDEMEKIRRENAHLKHRLNKYEPSP